MDEEKGLVKQTTSEELQKNLIKFQNENREIQLRNEIRSRKKELASCFSQLCQKELGITEDQLKRLPPDQLQELEEQLFKQIKARAFTFKIMGNPMMLLCGGVAIAVLGMFLSLMPLALMGLAVEASAIPALLFTSRRYQLAHAYYEHMSFLKKHSRDKNLFTSDNGR